MQTQTNFAAKKRIDKAAIKFAESDEWAADMNIYGALNKGYIQGAIDQLSLVQQVIKKLTITVPTSRGIAYNEALIDVLNEIF